jgi:hypothetical protein
VALLAAVCAARASADPDVPGVAVVVGKESVVARVTVDTLREVYLRRQRLWTDGVAAVPVNLPPDHRLRDAFSQRVLGRRAEDLVGYWRRLSFDGIRPPLVLQTPAAVCAYVATAPGAVGYVAPEDVDDAHCRVVVVLSGMPR